MDQPLFKSVVEQYDHRFDVFIEKDDGYLLNNITAILPTVRDAEILGAIPTALDAKPSVIVNGSDVVGMKANLLFGFGQASGSSIIGDTAYLYCSMLLLDKYIQGDGTYTASCFSNVSTSFLSKVRFSVSGPSKDILDEMISSIKLHVDRRELDYLLYRMIMYPFFIYLFLVVSALAWVTVKAVKFVKSG
jgi:hypothetical protein